MDFVTRHVRRTLRVILLFFAGILASVAGTYAYMRLRFTISKNRGIPEGPFPSLEPPPERSMDDIMERLERIPFRPVRPMWLGFVKAGINNSVLPVLNAARATGGRFYPYPADFDAVVLESFDGTPIEAAVGVHGDRPRPGLVISHGFMGSKNDHYIIDTALTAFSRWGFNVLGIDLRNFGRSQCYSHAPTTAGWKEGEDLLAAAKFLSDMPQVTSVGVMGFSMGAGSTMRAAFMASEYPYLTGGAIAWNGYSSARRMIEYISKNPGLADTFFPFYLSFRLMHFLRRRDMQKYVLDPELTPFLHEPFEQANFVVYAEKVACPHYGVAVEDYYRNASSAEYLSSVDVPLLIVHAADDPICPPDEMDPLFEIAEENPNLEVWMLPAGNHCMFRYLDRNWYESVVRSFFTYWATWDREGAARVG